MSSWLRFILIAAALGAAPWARCGDPVPACPEGPGGTRTIEGCTVEIAREGAGCVGRVRDASGSELCALTGRTLAIEHVSGSDFDRDGTPEIVLRSDQDDDTIVYRIVSCGAQPPLVKDVRTPVGVWFETYPRGRRLIALPDDGFLGFPDLEGGSPDEINLPVLRLALTGRRLEDAGRRFAAYYDVEIRRTRNQLPPAMVRKFVRGEIDDADLRIVRARVLKIVFSYLYSGRAKDAWSELRRSWPPGDVERIKRDILAARKRGSLRFVDQPKSDPDAKPRRERN